MTLFINPLYILWCVNERYRIYPAMSIPNIFGMKIFKELELRNQPDKGE